MIHLPVSVGEGVDKLTILDIKCKKIKDPERLAHCVKEYDALYSELEEYTTRFPFHYRVLYAINEEIWNIQDTFRESPDFKSCLDILNKNDMRFRMKNILNNLTSSHLREQKGYPKRRALVIHHLGLGDHVCMIGAVRYIALQHDQTTVFCYARNEKNVRSFYSDDPSIKLQIIDLNGPFEYTPSEYTNIYLSGEHAGVWNNSEFPNCFYDHMKMDRGIRYSYFHIPTSAKASELYEMVRATPYIFVQTAFLGNHGGGIVNSFLTWDVNETLTLDPNNNLYPKGHAWYDLAQSFINHPFSDYIEVIKHAKEIHVVNSSFYCLAAHLELDAMVKKCYLRETGEYDPKWSFRPF
jgi:hypothetical protein